MHKIYQAYKRDKQYKHPRYINTSERDMSNRKHGRIISRFEHPCSTSPPQRYEGFSLKSIPQDHLVPQHLQRVHTRNLGLTSFSLVPARTTQHELTSSPRLHLYNTLQYKVEHLMISSLITNKHSHNQSSYKIDKTIKSTS